MSETRCACDWPVDGPHLGLCGIPEHDPMRNTVSCPSCLGLWKRQPNDRPNTSCPDSWHLPATQETDPE